MLGWLTSNSAALIGFGGVIVALVVNACLARCAQKREWIEDRNRRDDERQHDREQEIRGRRTEALVDLYDRLETQADAIAAFAGFFRDPKGFKELYDLDKLYEARTVLRRKDLPC